MELNQEYWTNRYQQQLTGWDIGYASPPLVNMSLTIPKESTILIPGAGRGHEAIHLAKAGFTNVSVLDFSEEALTFVKKNDPTGSIQTFKGDFFLHHGAYDVILEQTFFCAIDPHLRTAYCEQMLNLLLPQGRLMGVLFAITFDKIGPPFGGSMEEYQALFEKYFEIVKLEPCTNSIGPRQGSECVFEVQPKQNI